MAVAQVFESSFSASLGTQWHEARAEAEKPRFEPGTPIWDMSLCILTAAPNSYPVLIFLARLANKSILCKVYMKMPRINPKLQSTKFI